MIDYVAMSGPHLIEACGDDGAKWAAAFIQHAEKLGHKNIDEDWMIGWFANAIEAAHDLRMNRISNGFLQGVTLARADHGK